MIDYMHVKFDYELGLLPNYTRMQLIEAKDILEFEKKKVNADIDKFGRTITLESKLINIDEILCEIKKLKLKLEN